MTDDVKSMSTGRFNRFAERYVQAAQLGQTDEPKKLVEMAQPQPTDRVLDIATGGGHTALAFAPYVREVVAHDLALGMLHAARTYLDSKEAPAWYVAADAEALPFTDASFDIVACRIAQHHFPDVFKFVRECARVLRPGGALLAGFCNPAAYIFDYPAQQRGDLVVRHALPYADTDLPQADVDRLLAEDHTLEFSHMLETQIGGQLAAGLMLTALYEDGDSEPQRPFARYFPPFIATRAIKPVIA